MHEHKELNSKQTLILIVIALLFHALLLLLILMFSDWPVQINNAEHIKEKLIPIIMQPPTPKPQNQSDFTLPEVQQKAGMPNVGVQKEQVNEKDEIQEEKAQNKIEKSEKIKDGKSLGNTQNINNKDLADENKNVNHEIKPKRRKILDYDFQRPTLPKEVMEGLMGLSPQGHHTFSYSGPNTKNDPESLKNASYLNKLYSFMQSSWSIQRKRLKTYKRASITITLIIDAKGNIISLTKNKSSGFEDLDEVVMDTIKYAAPYPPVPKHLNKETFTLFTTLYIY